MGKKFMGTATALVLSLSLCVGTAAWSGPSLGESMVPLSAATTSGAVVDPDEEPPLEGTGVAQVMDASEKYIALQVKTATGYEGRKAYTNDQQMERLLSFLPSEENRITLDTEPTADLPVELTYTNRDTVRTYLFYSSSECADVTDPEAPVYYSTHSAVWDLLTMMTGWEPYALDGTVTYKDEAVQKVYSLLYKNRTYHLVPNTEDVQKIVDALEEKKPDESVKIGNVGFLIFTDKGRYDVYFDTGSDAELVALSSEYVKEYARIQWISFMDPSTITSIEAYATIGGDVSFTSTEKQMDVVLKTKDPAAIQNISTYLKNIQVEPEIRRTEKAPRYKETPRMITMDITFESGTVYQIKTNGYSFTISASSMENEFITYTAASSQMIALSDYLSMMPGARLSEAKADKS